MMKWAEKIRELFDTQTIFYPAHCPALYTYDCRKPLCETWCINVTCVPSLSVPGNVGQPPRQWVQLHTAMKLKISVLNAAHMPTNSFICYFLRENLETKQPPFDVRVEIDIGKNYEGRFKLITLRVTSSSVLSSAKTALPISIAWHYSDFEVNYTTARVPTWRSIKAAQSQFQHYFMNR